MQITALWQKRATLVHLGTSMMAPLKWSLAPVSRLSNVNPAQQYTQDKTDKMAAIWGKSVYVKMLFWLLEANKKENMKVSQMSHFRIDLCFCIRSHDQEKGYWHGYSQQF